MNKFRDIKIQKKIYDIIAKNPRLYASKIAEILNLKISEVESHLDFLEKNEFVIAIEDEGHKLYNIKEITTGIRDKRILKTRRRIYNVVAKHPGLHISKIADILGMARSTIEYHLRSMEKDKLVVITGGERGYRRYCIVDSNIGTHDKTILSLLRQEIPLKIVLFLLKHPNSRHKDLLANLNLTSPTLSYHLNKLVNRGIVDVLATGAGFKIKNKDEIISFLQRYHLQKIIDRFTETWEDLQ